MTPDPYAPAHARYDRLPYRRGGASGLSFPVISLGLWQNFGGTEAPETGRAMLRHAFDRGVTHFDLANNYGPPYGSAEANFGRWFADDFRPFRDELLISSKAGYDMWPGPYGGPSGSRKHLIASCEASLRRTGLDHLDIFYSHRMDELTPVEETASALAQLQRQGKTLYVGVSSYDPERTVRIADLLRGEGIAPLVHQPRYSMLDRAIEAELLPVLDGLGMGCIVFSPLAQGLLSNRYISGIPSGSRASRGGTLDAARLTPSLIHMLTTLAAVARERRQSLAQMALQWVLRDDRVTSAIVGASSVGQLDELLDAATFAPFTADELTAIDAALASNDQTAEAGD